MKTLYHVARDFYWGGTKKHVFDFVAACPVCQRNKVESLKPAGYAKFLQPAHSEGENNNFI